MPITFAESQAEVAALVEHFRTNLNHFRPPGYKEAAARGRLQRDITVTDEKIDALVYELYGLTEEEIKIVEGK